MVESECRPLAIDNRSMTKSVITTCTRLGLIVKTCQDEAARNGHLRIDFNRSSCKGSSMPHLPLCAADVCYCDPDETPPRTPKEDNAAADNTNGEGAWTTVITLEAIVRISQSLTKTAPHIGCRNKNIQDTSWGLLNNVRSTVIVSLTYILRVHSLSAPVCGKENVNTRAEDGCIFVP